MEGKTPSHWPSWSPCALSVEEYSCEANYTLSFIPNAKCGIVDIDFSSTAYDLETNVKRIDQKLSKWLMIKHQDSGKQIP